MTVAGGGLGALALATITETGNGGAAQLAQTTALSLASGGVASVTVALAPGSLTAGTVALLGSSSGAGANADSAATVLFGPGSAAQVAGGQFTVSGVTSLTLVRVTRTFRAAESALGQVGTRATGSVSGSTLKVGAPQVEAGTGSSYVPCGAAPTTRSADLVTLAGGPLALLQASTASLALRGTLVQGGGSLLALIASGASGSQRGLLRAAGAQDEIANGSNTVGTGQPYGAPDVAFAAAWGTTGKIAAAGHAVASGSFGQLFAGSDTSVRLASSPSFAPVNLLLDELVVWAAAGSDAGVQGQARPFQ